MSASPYSAIASYAKRAALALTLCAAMFWLAGKSASAQPRQTPLTTGQDANSPSTAAAASPNSQNQAADKKSAVKPHHVFTNDDLSTHAPMLTDPAAQRRLDELNQCNDKCFDEILTESVRTFQYPYPRNEREKEKMQDALLSTLDDLRGDPEWQKRLAHAVAAKYAYCAAQREYTQRPSDADGNDRTISHSDLKTKQEEKENANQAGGSYNAAVSALLDYRWSSKPGPLKAAAMVHQYLSILTEQCVQAPDVDP